MKVRTFLLAGLFWLIAASCSRDAADAGTVYCTMEFRTIAVTVIGDSLTRTHTIREKTGDTLDVPNMPYPVHDGAATYAVLDDNFVSVLKDSEEMFRFVGFIHESLVVDEMYRISSDRCHVHLEEGKSEIKL